MFLKEIHIQNFKGFDDLRFSFTQENGEVRKHTILLGENGTGKSNLLKAIALVTASPDAISELLKQPNEWIKQGETTCRIYATTTDGRELKLAWSLGDKPTDIIRKNWENAPSLFSQYEVYGYGASRKLSLFNELALEPKQNYVYAKSIANLFDREHILYPLIKWILVLDYNSKEALHKKMYDFTKEKLNAFLTNIDFWDINRPEQQLLFKENDNILPLSALSDGYQNMAALVGDLLSKWSEKFNWGANVNRVPNFPKDIFDNHTNGLILIDEIDLHLHPKWQRALLDFLEKELPSFQIIATTHSPLTAQQASEGELFTLKKAENGNINVLAFKGSPDKMLVSDLLTAHDAFGLHSTESFKVENLKARYQVLKAKQDKTSEEQIEWDEIVSFLQIIPHKKGSAYFSAEHFHLLQEIKAELENR